MTTEPRLLSPDVCVLERVSAQTPAVVRRAIGFAGRLAADNGASVFADSGALDAEQPALREFLAAGKQELSSVPPDGVRLILRAADVVDIDQAQGLPGVVVSALPGIRQDGDAFVSELTIQAQSGLCDLIGDPKRQPLKLGGHQAAFSTGYGAYAALCAVLLKWQRFGDIEQATVDALSVTSWVNWKAVLLGGGDRVLKREGDLAEWPVLPCIDGHVAVVFTETDWPTLVRVIDDARLADERFASFDGRVTHRKEYQGVIAGWVAARTKAQLSNIFRDARLPSGVIATILDLLSDPLLQHRQAFTGFVAKSGEKGLRPVAPHRAMVASGPGASANPRDGLSHSMSDRNALPLQGVRVLDLGIITAGAGVSALLADMGADVLKIESHTYPDPFRDFAGDSANGSPMFRYTNRNKKGVAIDLKQASGKAEFFRLVAGSDIVLENFRRGVMERLGIGFDQLVAANPNIMLASLTAQGLTGPGSENASFGSAIEARSGIASITGYPDESPVISGRNLNYPDQIACLYGAATVVAGVHWQRTHAGAVHLDCSQRDLAIFTLGDRIIESSLLADSDPDMGVSGNADPDYVFQDVCLTADQRWLAVSVTPENQAEVCRELQLEGIASLTDWIGGSDFNAALQTMASVGVAAAAALDGAQVFNDTRVKLGPAIGYTPDGELAKGFPFQFEQSPMRIRRGAPAIGEHSVEVLGNEPD